MYDDAPANAPRASWSVVLWRRIHSDSKSRFFHIFQTERNRYNYSSEHCSFACGDRSVCHQDLSGPRVGPRDGVESQCRRLKSNPLRRRQKRKCLSVTVRRDPASDDLPRRLSALGELPRFRRIGPDPVERPRRNTFRAPGRISRPPPYCEETWQSRTA
jgi:hypothetical protein